MDGLLSSLRALSLLPPTPSQLLQLLSSSSSQEEEDQQVKDLARVLSLGAFDPEETERGSEDDDAVTAGAGFGIDRQLIEDAVVEIIRTFKREVQKARRSYEDEQAALGNPVALPKLTSLHHLKLRQASYIRQSDKITALYRGYRPRLIFSGGPSFASSHELASLRPVEAAADLKVGKRLSGQFIVARIASQVSLYVGASFLVTFPAPLGFSSPISIAHFSLDVNMSAVEASRLLPEGSLIAIKEPYFSSDYSARVGGLGGVGIRVDTPTDIVLLKSGRNDRTTLLPEELQSYLRNLEWKQEMQPPAKGKAKGRGKHVSEAVTTVTTDDPAPSGVQTGHATWLSEGECSAAVLLGQSVENTNHNEIVSFARQLLSQGRPGAAWRELLSADRSTNRQAEQAAEELDLKGDILSELSAWQASLDAYQAAQSQYGADSGQRNAAIEHKILQTRYRIAEAQGGPSNDVSTILRTYRAHLASQNPRIPTADWLSPALTVAQIPDAGRGLVVARPVSAGEPLLLARSRGSCYPSDDDLETSPILRCDFQNGVLSTTTQILATTRLIHLMIDRPEITPEIMGLTAGPKTDDSPWVIADEFEKASAPLSPTSAWQDLSASRIGPQGGINALYVDEVLRHNAFGPGVVQRVNTSDDTTEKRSETSANKSQLPPSLKQKLDCDPPSAFSRSTQPHPLPAILNHSCLPNVSSVFLGDVVVTKALRDLHNGEEIGHEYVKGGLDYQSRQSLLSKHGFVCRCHLCDLDRADGEDRLTTRRRLFAVKAPALFARSDALLNHHLNASTSGIVEDAEARQKSQEQHEDINSALLELHRELQETYAADRGLLRPEMRDIQERIGRHAALQGQSSEGLAFQFLLKSVQSAGAIWTEVWEAMADGKGVSSADPSIDDLSQMLSVVSFDQSTVALCQCPPLHVDEVQRTLWRLSEFFLDHSFGMSEDARQQAHEDAKTKSLIFSKTAYFVHNILIGGGSEVFRDRWGPVTEGEKKGLEWRRAWHLWETQCQ